MLESFTHEYAERAEVAMRHEGGGFVSDVLVIIAKIPLHESTPGFDQAKVDALFAAAVEYSTSKNHPYASICFMSYDHANRT